MKLILDEGMPLGTAAMLREAEMDAVHVLELGMGGAPDGAILAKARQEGAAAATLGADFHQILAATGESGPSVIRVRVERLRSAELASLPADVLSRTRNELSAGVAVSVLKNKLRLRKLPLHG